MALDVDTIPGAAGAPPLREDVMLEDVGKALEAQAVKDEAARKAAEAKVATDAEAAARAAAGGGENTQVRALQEALRISEEGRRRTEEMLRTAAAPVREAPPAELTEDQWNELYQKNPLAAIELKQAQANKKLLDNIEQRLAPLVSGGATSAKELARAKYPDEFRLFDADIQQMLSDPRISPASMNNIQAWDDLVSFIRGKPANFEKLIEDRANKARNKAADDAHTVQQAVAGAHTRSDVRPLPPASASDLDSVEKEIARAIHPDLDPEEAYASYKTWKGVATR